MTRRRVEPPDEPIPGERSIALVTGPSRGYIIHVSVRGRRLTRWCGVAKYGSWAAALGAAREIRDTLCMMRAPADRRDAPIGRRGVGVARRANGLWVAYWRDRPGAPRRVIACGRGLEGEVKARALRLEAERLIASGRSTDHLAPLRRPRLRSPEERAERIDATLRAREERLVTLLNRIKARLQLVRKKRRELAAMVAGGQAPPIPLRIRVVGLLAQGMTPAQVAAELGITRRAVYAHAHKARCA